MKAFLLVKEASEALFEQIINHLISNGSELHGPTMMVNGNYVQPVLVKCCGFLDDFTLEGRGNRQFMAGDIVVLANDFSEYKIATVDRDKDSYYALELNEIIDDKTGAHAGRKVFGLYSATGFCISNVQCSIIRHKEAKIEQYYHDSWNNISNTSKPRN